MTARGGRTWWERHEEILKILIQGLIKKKKLGGNVYRPKTGRREKDKDGDKDGKAPFVWAQESLTIWGMKEKRGERMKVKRRDVFMNGGEKSQKKRGTGRQT